MTAQMDLLNFSWERLPSPKVRQRDRRGVYTWATLYSAFSESFAENAIAALLTSGQEIILDPFCGVGTTLVAAAKHGNPVIGIDLDPFSALLSRAAIATNAVPAKVESILNDNRDGNGIEFSEEARDLFQETDLLYAKKIFMRLHRLLGNNSGNPLAPLLDDPEGAWDSEAVALAAVGVASNHSARVVRGSNPVWYRKTAAGELGRRSVDLYSSAELIARGMLRDLAELRPLFKKRDVRILNADSRLPALSKHSIDFVLTSPPYLNRLDYVINHLAPLTLLSGLIDIDLDYLRRQMIGTTKIVGKDLPSIPEWGPICLGVLEEIASHESKASKTYYYWNFHKYFADIFVFLSNLKQWCAARARGLIVVQNSYYKAILIPVPEILIEMGHGLGLSMRVVRREAVRTHLGIINPHQMTYAPRKVLEESILFFEIDNYKLNWPSDPVSA